MNEFNEAEFSKVLVLTSDIYNCDISDIFFPLHINV